MILLSTLSEADTVGGDARRAEPVTPESLHGALSDTDEVDVPGVPLEPPGTRSLYVLVLFI